jgi:hypothetical protein
MSGLVQQHDIIAFVSEKIRRSAASGSASDNDDICLLWNLLHTSIHLSVTVPLG